MALLELAVHHVVVPLGCRRPGAGRTGVLRRGLRPESGGAALAPASQRAELGGGLQGRGASSAQQAAQLVEVPGDRLPLPGEVVHLALRGAPGPLGLRPRLGQHALGVQPSLGQGLVGVAAGVGHQRLGLLVGVAAGGLGGVQGLGRPGLGGTGPTLGLPDQGLHLVDGRVVTVGGLALGLLTRLGELHVQVGALLAGLGADALDQLLRLGPRDVRVVAGRGAQLIGLPLGGDPHLGGLAVGGGAEPSHVALGGGPLLGGVLFRGRDQPGGLALGALDELVGPALRVGPDLVGLAVRGVQQLLGLAGGGRAALGHGVLGGGSELRDLQAGLGPHRLGVVRGLGDHVGGLLLGEAEQLLDPGPEPGVRRPLALAQLPVGLRQLAGQLHGPGVEVLDPGTGLPEGALEVAQPGLHLAAVVAAHDDGELVLVGVAHCGAPRRGWGGFGPGRGEPSRRRRADRARRRAGRKARRRAAPAPPAPRRSPSGGRR